MKTSFLTQENKQSFMIKPVSITMVSLLAILSDNKTVSITMMSLLAILSANFLSDLLQYKTFVFLTPLEITLISSIIFDIWLLALMIINISLNSLNQNPRIALNDNVGYLLLDNRQDAP